MRVRQRFRAFDQIRLAQIIFRHGAIEAAELIEKNRFLLDGKRELAFERRRHGIARDIVLRRTQATDQDKDVAAIERCANRLSQARAIVADHLFAGDFHAQEIQMPRDDQGICIDTLGRQQLTADGDDLGLLRIRMRPRELMATGVRRCSHRRGTMRCWL